MIKLKVNGKNHQFTGDPAMPAAAAVELTAAQSGAKASAAGRNRLTRKGGKE